MESSADTFSVKIQKMAKHQHICTHYLNIATPV